METLAIFCLLLGSTLALTNKEKSCLGKADPGRCLAYMPSYYYDAETNTCKRFIYGGCGGNGNRYATEVECLNNCKVDRADVDPICKLEPDAGPCRGAFPAYYFDASSGECKSMVYGGCRGNENRFSTSEDCYKKCAPHKIDVRSALDVCSLEVDSGPCRAFIPQYYYNKETKSCEEFIYGGCKGNDNRFATKESCHALCKDVTFAPETTPSNCVDEPEVGRCRGRFPRYYYNGKECKLFIYGGCGGNGNNYKTRSSCVEACLSN